MSEGDPEVGNLSGDEFDRGNRLRFKAKSCSWYEIDRDCRSCRDAVRNCEAFEGGVESRWSMLFLIVQHMRNLVKSFVTS